MKLEQKVYKKLLEVPEGKITTYGELAKAVGLKNGQRTIGRIMNKHADKRRTQNQKWQNIRF